MLSSSQSRWSSVAAAARWEPSEECRADCSAAPAAYWSARRPVPTPRRTRTAAPSRPVPRAAGSCRRQACLPRPRRRPVRHVPCPGLQPAEPAISRSRPRRRRPVMAWFPRPPAWSSAGVCAAHGASMAHGRIRPQRRFPGDRRFHPGDCRLRAVRHPVADACSVPSDSLGPGEEHDAYRQGIPGSAETTAARCGWVTNSSTTWPRTARPGRTPRASRPSTTCTTARTSRTS